MKRLLLVLLIVAPTLLAGCGSGPGNGRMVGELAWDRVELSNEAAEPIRDIPVREGQQVATGELLVQLDTARAQATLAGVQARLTEAKLELDRQRQLVKKHLTSPEQVDRANSAWEQAQADEQQAQLALERLTIRAPQPGRVDSLPFEIGERPPVGSVLAVLLVGEAPYARLYVPEPLRSRVAVGDSVQVHVDGREQEFTGRVRRVASDPAFTPFFALSENDRSQLVYLAEVTLRDAADLPSGLPAEGWLQEQGE
jgi:HlyD family secretion protein